MNNLKLNPLDIPEILSLIGSFLDRKDILNCIRVSKTFHNVLVGSLWRIINVCKSRYPASIALQRHKGCIEEIRFEYDFVPEEFGSLRGCDRLQCIDYQGISLSEPIHFLNLIKAHNSVITRFLLKITLAWRELWEILLGCVNLNHLTALHTRIGDEVNIFFQVCKNVGYLGLFSVSIYQLPVDFLSNDYFFPNIHTLVMSDVRIASPPHPYTSSYCLGMLVKRCPRLCTLHFDEKDEYLMVEQPSHSTFYKTTFLQHPWILTSLSDVSIPSMYIKDEDMAALLRQLTELRRLYTPACRFGQFSLKELLATEQEVLDNGHIVRKRRLKRLCETIKMLEFSKQSYVSGVVQAILSNCPMLTLLRGSKITVTEIVNGAEWVSTGLAELSIYLEANIDQETADGMAKARIVFKQLGKLTQLRFLSLTAWSLYDNGQQTLGLKLRAGLDELDKLKSLWGLRFQNDGQQRIGLEEATWIVNNWPCIRSLYGRMTPELDGNQKDVNALVYNFFSSHNIRIYI
ncbi:hypothetical protein BCR41DRAFT_344187 [Lobosporangium transversale]|uniref:F-box domain-containing protein n=1 Tax=Lobosporangium transversale TaxID=64571 RepID=A0A1Y2H2U1_9FUNG|nr:hypothetical protein BCR41DRAFT_344187 [Lobosporangium transversale]ORZ28855.1 hypothetical protein BCR41DRAFT_344187 [Lobosporangium transversale]|eukprot:XP_021886528.1 hypothetical protein BCR41DRAFT_344187 [Lobosporangium transversale]